MEHFWYVQYVPQLGNRGKQDEDPDSKVHGADRTQVGPI